MAKAQFHRHQKVWVESVGSWAAVERIIPVWVKGFDEPVRISYDVGLGREFRADELMADTSVEPAHPNEGEAALPGWRVLRARNKWQAPEDCGHHPLPGTIPVVVTNATDWGGWRVPAAEYDRDPRKVEQQARLITASPRLLRMARELAELAGEAPDEISADLLRLARRASALVHFVGEEAPPLQAPALTPAPDQKVHAAE